MGRPSRRHRTANTRRSDTDEFDDPRLSAAAAEGEHLLGMLVRGRAWPRGWQPDELVRHVRRRLPSARHVDLVVNAVAADAARRDDEHLVTHQVWRRQTDAIAAAAQYEPARRGWLARWLRDQGDISEGLSVARSVIDELLALPPLPTLIAPPGTSGCQVVDAPDASVVVSRTLVRVQGLLAKAESSEFRAEAEAFTAKAQAIMAEARLDEATVRGRTATPGGSRVSAIRIPVDEPYVSEKSFLLHVVAEANDCRAVRHGDLALVTVVGPAATLRAVELLFTSLLIQVQAALAADTADSLAGCRTRSRRYRASFIVGFARRVGERLKEARAGAVVGAPSDALPVLAADLRATSELLERLVGPTVLGRSRATHDPLGVASGAVAADRAALRDAGLGRSSDEHERRPPEALER